MNRRPFNRAGFNRLSQTTQGAGGITLMKMKAAPVTARRDIVALLNPASSKMTGTCKATNVKYAGGSAALIMSGSGKATKVIYASAGYSEMIMSGSADSIVQGEAVINLRDDQTGTWLSLSPGDELIINTEEMTVTINSQNGMRYFSTDSDFFSLLSGANTIVYGDLAGSRKVSVDVIWKDRWL